MKKWILLVIMSFLTLTLSSIAQAVEPQLVNQPGRVDWEIEKKNLPVYLEALMVQADLIWTEGKGYEVGHRWTRFWLKDNFGQVSPALEKIGFGFQAEIKRQANGDNKFVPAEIALGYRLFDWLTLEAGQISSPWIALEPQPYKLLTYGYSVVCSNLLVPEDLGVRAIAQWRGLKFYTGVLNGAGKNQSDNNSAKDISLGLKWESVDKTLRLVIGGQTGQQPEGPRHQLVSSIHWRFKLIDRWWMIKGVYSQEWSWQDRWGFETLLACRVSEHFEAMAEYNHFNDPTKQLRQYTIGTRVFLVGDWLTLKSQIDMQEKGELALKAVLQLLL